MKLPTYPALHSSLLLSFQAVDPTGDEFPRAFFPGHHLPNQATTLKKHCIQLVTVTDSTTVLVSLRRRRRRRRNPSLHVNPTNITSSLALDN